MSIGDYTQMKNAIGFVEKNTNYNIDLIIKHIKHQNMRKNMVSIFYLGEREAN